MVASKFYKAKIFNKIRVLHQARDGNGDRRPVQNVPVQGEPREENGNRRERRPATDSRVVAHLHRSRVRRRPTTIDAPTEAQMLTPTRHRSSNGRLRT
jgi:hypothetical protein